MMKPEQAKQVRLGIIQSQLSDLSNNADAIYKKARTLDLDYLVDSKISRACEAVEFLDDVYGFASQFSIEHRLKRYEKGLSIIENIIPENVDNYIEGLQSWEDSETSYKRELSLDYCAFR